MADTIEFEGTTEQEAVARAAETMGIEPDDVDYTMADEGSGGMFGLGSRPVKIRVRPPGGEGADDSSAERAPPGPAPEKAKQAGEVAEAILGHMGLSAKVEVRDDEMNIVVVIDEADGEDVKEVLGGTKPPSIPALQFLLNKIVNRFPEDRKHIKVEAPSVPRRPTSRSPERAGAPSEPAPLPDLEALRERLDPELDPELVAVGLELATKARQLNKVLTVHPMLPGDRRAVHQTVTNVPGVRTVSDGEGLYRRMHVVPDALGGDAGGGRGKKKRRRRRRGPKRTSPPAAEV